MPEDHAVTNAAGQDCPRAVKWAFAVWVIATFVGLIGAVLLFANALPGVLIKRPIDDPDSAIALAVALTGWGLVRLVFAWFMLRGHRWARTLLTTLAAIGLVVVTFHAEHANPLNGVSVAMNAAAVVLQFLPSSNAYFARRHHDAVTSTSRTAVSAERDGATGAQPAPPVDGTPEPIDNDR